MLENVEMVITVGTLGVVRLSIDGTDSSLKYELQTPHHILGSGGNISRKTMEGIILVEGVSTSPLYFHPEAASDIIVVVDRNSSRVTVVDVQRDQTLGVWKVDIEKVIEFYKMMVVNAPSINSEKTYSDIDQNGSISETFISSEITLCQRRVTSTMETKSNNILSVTLDNPRKLTLITLDSSLSKSGERTQVVLEPVSDGISDYGTYSTKTISGDPIDLHYSEDIMEIYLEGVSLGTIVIPLEFLKCLTEGKNFPKEMFDRIEINE